MLLIALHITNDICPDSIQQCIAAGSVKLNLNLLLLACWHESLRENVHLPLMQCIDKEMKLLQEEVERCMDVCGGSDKAHSE